MYKKLKLVLFSVITFSISNVNVFCNNYLVEYDKFLQKNYLTSKVDIWKTKSILLEQLKNAGLYQSTNMIVEHFCNLSFRLGNEFSLLVLFINKKDINNPYIFDEIFQQKIFNFIVYANMPSFEYSGKNNITIAQFFYYLSNKTYAMALKTINDIQNTVSNHSESNTDKIIQIEKEIKVQLNSYIDNIKIIVNEFKDVMMHYLCIYYNFHTDNLFINNTMKSLIRIQEGLNNNS